jgi:nitrogen PTS system EIIA component
MKLQPLIQPELSFILDEVAGRDQLLGQLADRIAGVRKQIDGVALEAALTHREQQEPTSTPQGVAFPHAMYEGAGETLVAAAVLKSGVSFGRKDHPPSDVVFVLVGPPESAWQHVSILARLARICHAPGALDRIRAACDGHSLYDALIAEDQRHG